MAELGFVGDGPNSYQVWLGGSLNATRLAEPFAERVKAKVRRGDGFGMLLLLLPGCWLRVAAGCGWVKED